MATQDDGTSTYNGDSTVCGYCQKMIARKTNSNWDFQKCDLCQNEHPLHSKCASKLWKNISLKQTQTVPNYDRDIFIGKKTVGLLCFECRRKCFYCDVNHTGGGKL